LTAEQQQPHIHTMLFWKTPKPQPKKGIKVKQIEYKKYTKQKIGRNTNLNTCFIYLFIYLFDLYLVLFI
jgi:hypothetical protein